MRYSLYVITDYTRVLSIIVGEDDASARKFHVDVFMWESNRQFSSHKDAFEWWEKIEADAPNLLQLMGDNFHELI